MNRIRPLSFWSLLSIVLLSLHFVDDIVRGISPVGLDNVGACAILAFLLLGTLVLGERRSGQVIMILGGIFALGMPIIHLRGTRIVAIAAGEGGFFFMWTLIALGTTGLFTIVLAAVEMWRQRAGAKT